MTFARDKADSTIYSETYDYCKKGLTLKQEDGAEGSLSLLAVSGIVMLVPLFPIDTGKS